MRRQRGVVDGWPFEPDRNAVVFAGLRAAVKPSVLPRAPENLFPRLANRLLASAAALAYFRIESTPRADACASTSDFIWDTGRLVVGFGQSEPLEHARFE